MIKINLKKFSIGNNLPFVLIAGPCVIENEIHSLLMVEKIDNICKKLKINYIYKSSFDKANRSSIESKRGIGIKKSIKIFKKIKSEFNCPIITDVHNEYQCNYLSNEELRTEQARLIEKYSDKLAPIIRKKQKLGMGGSQTLDSIMGAM